MKTHLYPIGLLIAAILLTGCAAATPTPVPPSDAAAPPPEVIAEGHLTPARSEALTFPVRGRIAEVLVEAGQAVSEGQVLVRLGDREQAQAVLTGSELELAGARQAVEALDRLSALANAQARQALLNAQVIRAEAERAWERLDLDSLDQAIEDALATVEDRRADLKDAQAEFDKYRDLDEDNSSRQNAEDRLEQAREDLNEANRRLDTARARRDTPRAALDVALAAEAEARRAAEHTRGGPDPDQVELAEARLANAEAQVAAARAALERFDLKAPFDGRVIDLPVEADQAVGPETVVVVLADVRHWTVDTSDLTELEVVKVNLGDPVTLVADALPGELVDGTVTEIVEAPRFQGGDVLYTVRVTPAGSDGRWRWGMTFEVTFAGREN